MTRFIYILFTASGFIGLVYESLFARYLKLFLGHSAYGQILTLVVYMGGLGIGSFAGASLARRSRNPFMLYAVIEGLVGLAGILYHPLYLLSTGWFYSFQGLTGLPPVVASVLKVALMTVVTTPVTVLLGMTFPCIAIAMMRLTEDGGKASLPLLYFTNSLGAAAGIMMTSYLFIPGLGTAGSLGLAAAGNLALSVSFGLVAWQAGQIGGVPLEQSVSPLIENRGTGRSLIAFWLCVAALTGFSSFVYEIGWIRLLSLVMGSATHSFDIMVSAFILGLAFGGLFSKWLIGRVRSTGFALAGAQVAMGVLALGTIYAYKPFFLLMNQSHLLFVKNDTGFVLLSGFKYLLAAGLMFPACFCAGMTLPLITYGLMKATGDERYTGRVYGFNTLGSIVGAVAGGLWLLPALQLKYTIAAGAAIDLCLGLWILGSCRPDRRIFAAVAAVCIAAAVPVFAMSFDGNVTVAGQYRHRTTFAVHDTTVVRDGATATVSFQKYQGSLVLKSNGKVEASLCPRKTGDREDDEYTQAAVAFIPMACLNKPYRAAMIGMGSGMAAHHLLADPLLQSLDIVEIEPAVFTVARGFYPYNRRAYDDPRAKRITGDAKTYFHINRKRYDLIVSEPSNPWVSGVSGLFTREFYARIAANLAPGGVLVQWIHLYEFDSELMLDILKALDDVFPGARIFKVPQNSDLVIVACKAGHMTFDTGRIGRDIATAADLAALDVPAGFFGPQLCIASAASLKPLLESAQPNSDFVPLVDDGAEKAFFLDRRVDLFGQYEYGFSMYQELLEPDSFATELAAIRTAKATEPVDVKAMATLDSGYARASEKSNWDLLDSLFYLTVYDYAGTTRWDSLRVVTALRKLVYDGIPPWQVQERFRLLDAAARLRHGDALAIASAMAEHYPVEEAGPAVIRAMVIEALRGGDRALAQKVYVRFVRGNDDMNRYERKLIAALVSINEHGD